MIQQTSLEAFEKIKPKLGKKQQELLNLYQKHGSLYDQMAAFLLKKPINCVTPRRNELEKKGLIYKNGTAKSIYTDQTVNTYIYT